MESTEYTPVTCLEFWKLFRDHDCLLPALSDCHPVLVSASLCPPLCYATGCRGDLPVLFRVCERGLKEMEAAAGVEVEPCSPPPARLGTNMTGWTLEVCVLKGRL